MAQFTAHLRYLRVAPRKVRLVADTLRGQKVQEALDRLLFSKASSSKDLAKLIRSAVANADKKGGVDIDRLIVRTLYVNEGPILRRSLARARGSASRINKKTSHITLVLED
ncbi:MAG: 50S ribosomal protein L22 [Deltaproteobacteria bacterium]|nr:50S ribosomal protein L22 [Deltaproteobacteria bacterium]MBI2500320.1 50S ribosomal protein L22 [Deltaproteobacteria bacterium]MBI4196474.1 50S ribosomal protein L22 [Deltaproteobacteria bacterium]